MRLESCLAGEPARWAAALPDSTTRDLARHPQEQPHEYEHERSHCRQRDRQVVAREREPRPGKVYRLPSTCYVSHRLDLREPQAWQHAPCN